MQLEIKGKTKNILAFILCILAYIVGQILIIRGNRMGTTAYNGVLTAIQFAICLMMVRRDNKKGVIISLILMSFSIMGMLRALFFAHLTAPLPGLCNSLIYVFTILMLSKQFKKREQEAITDVLTGLHNRRGLYTLLKRKTEARKGFHVIYLDLGNFKFINDNYGHSYGDFIMKVVSERILTEVDDMGSVARMGGDEFVILLDEGSDPEKLTNRVIDKIAEKISLMVDGTKVECYLTAFSGIASYPNDTMDYEELLKYADIAMYQASKDKIKIRHFDKDMEQAILRRMELEKFIKEALDKDYFYLVYQPQFHLEGKKLRGFESLLRLKMPDGTMVSPGEFIPVAEKGDLILAIDDYVLKRAMREFKEIVRKVNTDLVISVNVSAKNFGSKDFVKKVYEILRDTAFPAENLEIEITEYCLVQDVDVTIENIKELRGMGVQIALDDFGTGYTSLSYLSKMPVNLLKVDKSLIDDIEKEKKSCDFVNAVVAMGHLMGCEVISEGVENENQLAILKAQGCDFVQGYVWGKPLEYEVATDLCHQ